MKILLVGHFVDGSLEVSYANAFRKVGCEIVRFDYMDEYSAVNPLAHNRYANRFIGGFFYRPLNRRLLESVKLHKPEVVFVFKGMFFFPETLQEIKKSGAPLLFNFNPDNPFSLNRGASNDFVRKAMPLYDCYFIWGKFLIPQLKNAGAQRVEYLPFACDLDLHRPVVVSDEERGVYSSDIAFFGTWEREREDLLEHLSDYDVAIWGNSWEKLKRGSPLRRKWKRGGNLGGNIAKLCNASRIVLNFIRKQNHNAHNLRTFEIPACGGFMLTTRTEEQCEFFQEGKDIACFETGEELRMKVKEYLCGEDVRREFGRRAYTKAQAHTYRERASRILEIYRDLRSSS